MPPEIEVYPATAERWGDLEALFGLHGAYSGCWCMYWRLRRADFNKIKGEGRKGILKQMTFADQVPGLLAYLDGRPIGWCSIGLREGYAALERSRTLKRVDDQPVWSIVCFFVAKAFHNKGTMTALLRGALRYAEQNGARIVEGYPIELRALPSAEKTLHGCGGYMGIASTFRAVGFVEVGRASQTQRIMRYTIHR